MKMKIATMTTVVVAAMLASSGYAMPRNSYLLRPARTHVELMNQIKSEPVVMDRFMRHFGMDRQEVLDLVGGLKLGRLEKTAVYMIYGVPRNGKLHSTPQLLKRGTLVWEDSAGEPILLEICGNPFTAGNKRTTMNAMITVAPEDPSPLVAMSSLPTQPVSSAPVQMSMIPQTPTAPEPIDPNVEPVTERSRPNLAWLLAVPAAAAIGFRDGGNDEPVPEPATMTAMAIGAGYMALKRRKQQGKK